MALSQQGPRVMELIQEISRAPLERYLHQSAGSAENDLKTIMKSMSPEDQFLSLNQYMKTAYAEAQSVLSSIGVCISYIKSRELWRAGGYSSYDDYFEASDLDRTLMSHIEKTIGKGNIGVSHPHYEYLYFHYH